jgi:hypothetical protein
VLVLSPGGKKIKSAADLKKKRCRYRRRQQRAFIRNMLELADSRRRRRWLGRAARIGRRQAVCLGLSPSCNRACSKIMRTSYQQVARGAA